MLLRHSASLHFAFEGMDNRGNLKGLLFTHRIRLRFRRHGISRLSDLACLAPFSWYKHVCLGVHHWESSLCAMSAGYYYGGASKRIKMPEIQSAWPLSLLLAAASHLPDESTGKNQFLMPLASGGVAMPLIASGHCGIIRVVLRSYRHFCWLPLFPYALQTCAAYGY